MDCITTISLNDRHRTMTLPSSSSYAESAASPSSRAAARVARLPSLAAAAGLCLSAMLGTTAPVHAQPGASAPGAAAAWPARPVRLVATFSPGGGADLTGRIIGARLAETWKQTVVVENRPGAGGSIGAEMVFRATPDGHTLLVVATTHTVNAALLPKLPFDLVRDFKPVAMATAAPVALVVTPRLKAATLQEFTSLLRAQPGKLDYASCGLASTHHFAMEAYKFETKTNALHIPTSCANAVAMMMGSQLDIGAVTLATARAAGDARPGRGAHRGGRPGRPAGSGSAQAHGGRGPRPVLPLRGRHAQAARGRHRAQSQARGRGEHQAGVRPGTGIIAPLSTDIPT
jgi:hypothetical protein